MNRYAGHYAMTGQGAASRAPKLTCSSVTHINLWDMVDSNQMYDGFQTVEGRSTTRQARQEYCYRRFGKYFGDRVLDVGCDQGVLGELHDKFYVGVDKYGEPDVRIDLEKGFLPFGKHSFDTVVCLEVLEHVDALHRLFSELVRCSRDVVIVTLPNCWRQVFGELVFGRSSKAEYGLPPENPRDRHKWFFNTEEAESFVAWQAQQQGMEILEVEYVHNIGDLFSLSLGLGHKSFFYPPQKHRREMGAFTRFATAFVSLLEKTVKACLLMVGRRGRNTSVVNIWFVLRKKRK